MDWFWHFISFVKNLVWSPWTFTLLIGTGIWLTIVLGFPQIRYFKLMVREIISISRKKHFDEHCISPFTAMNMALLVTIGIGNIAGVATALHLGGPGALVWMFFSAILGMATKFAEIVLAVFYREQDEDGHLRGGTMYILENALGLKWLAVVFALLIILSAFGGGGLIQSNSAAEGLFIGFHIPHLWTGIVVAFFVGLVIWGGIARIAKVATYLVPILIIFYISVSLIAIISHFNALPSAIINALKAAFSDAAALPGALTGWGVKAALTNGISRGIFSNEAGLGSAPIAHSTAQTDHPVRQGLYGLFEVFIDTIVICTISALVVLVTGVMATNPKFTGSQLMLVGFQHVFGTFGVYVLSFSIFFFAMTSLCGWYWYAETALVYLLGYNKHIIILLKIFWLWSIIYGSVGKNGLLVNLWNLSDIIDGFRAVLTLICLLLLTTQLRGLVQDFDTKRKTRELL